MDLGNRDRHRDEFGAQEWIWRTGEGYRDEFEAQGWIWGTGTGTGICLGDSDGFGEQVRSIEMRLGSRDRHRNGFGNR